MKKSFLVLSVMFLSTSMVFAQPMFQQGNQQGTPKLSDIKAVSAQASTQPTVYEIPMTQMMEKADGSGLVEVSVPPIKVTKEQLTQGIANANKQITIMQGQVSKLQAQLDAITAKEAASAPVSVPSTTTETLTTGGVSTNSAQ